MPFGVHLVSFSFPMAASLEMQQQSHYWSKGKYRPKGESLRAIPIVWSGYKFRLLKKKFRLLLGKNQKPPLPRLHSSHHPPPSQQLLCSSILVKFSLYKTGTSAKHVDFPLSIH